jgi:hypothetical protein
MKDLLIAIAILFILVAVFSQCYAPPEQETPPDTHGEGTREKGESNTILRGEDDSLYMESPKTGYIFF